MANAKTTSKKTTSKKTTKKTTKESSTKPSTQTQSKLQHDPIEVRQESKHDLDQLAQESPHPGPLFRSVALGGRSEGELVELGQSYSTDDILRSAPGFVSAIVEQNISPEQRALLVGYSPEKVALLVHETRLLRSMNQGFDERSATANAVARRNQLRQATGEGVALRDTVLRVLEELIPPATADRAALDAARGTADTPTNLTRTLRALSRLVTTVHAQAPAETRAIYESLGLTDRLAGDLVRSADAIDASEKLVLGSTGTRLNQRELDYQDGVVLTLLASLWRAFDEAHERSPTLVVPPLGRIARLTRKRRASSQAEPATPVTPVEPAPTS